MPSIVMAGAREAPQPRRRKRLVDPLTDFSGRDAHLEQAYVASFNLRQCSVDRAWAAFSLILYVRTTAKLWAASSLAVRALCVAGSLAGLPMILLPLLPAASAWYLPRRSRFVLGSRALRAAAMLLVLYSFQEEALLPAASTVAAGKAGAGTGAAEGAVLLAGAVIRAVMLMCSLLGHQLIAREHLLSVLSSAPVYLLTMPRRCAAECALSGSGAAYASLVARLRGAAQLCPRLWICTAAAGSGGFCGGGGVAAGAAAACEAECMLVQLWMQVAVGILLPTVVVAISDELARQEFLLSYSAQHPEQQLDVPLQPEAHIRICAYALSGVVAAALAWWVLEAGAEAAAEWDAWRTP